MADRAVHFYRRVFNDKVRINNVSPTLVQQNFTQILSTQGQPGQLPIPNGNEVTAIAVGHIGELEPSAGSPGNPDALCTVALGGGDATTGLPADFSMVGLTDPTYAATFGPVGQSFCLMHHVTSYSQANPIKLLGAIWNPPSGVVSGGFHVQNVLILVFDMTVISSSNRKYGEFGDIAFPQRLPDDPTTLTLFQDTLPWNTSTRDWWVFFASMVAAAEQLMSSVLYDFTGTGFIGRPTLRSHYTWPNAVLPFQTYGSWAIVTQSDAADELRARGTTRESGFGAGRPTIPGSLWFRSRYFAVDKQVLQDATFYDLFQGQRPNYIGNPVTFEPAFPAQTEYHPEIEIAQEYHVIQAAVSNRGSTVQNVGSLRLSHETIGRFHRPVGTGGLSIRQLPAATPLSTHYNEEIPVVAHGVFTPLAGGNEITADPESPTFGTADYLCIVGFHLDDEQPGLPTKPTPGPEVVISVAKEALGLGSLSALPTITDENGRPIIPDAGLEIDLTGIQTNEFVSEHGYRVTWPKFLVGRRTFPLIYRAVRQADRDTLDTFFRTQDKGAFKHTLHNESTERAFVAIPDTFAWEEVGHHDTGPEPRYTVSVQVIELVYLGA